MSRYLTQFILAVRLFCVLESVNSPTIEVPKGGSFDTVRPTVIGNNLAIVAHDASGNRIDLYTLAGTKLRSFAIPKDSSLAGFGDNDDTYLLVNHTTRSLVTYRSGVPIRTSNADKLRYVRVAGATVLTINDQGILTLESKDRRCTVDDVLYDWVCIDTDSKRLVVLRGKSTGSEGADLWVFAFDDSVVTRSKPVVTISGRRVKFIPLECSLSFLDPHSVVALASLEGFTREELDKAKIVSVEADKSLKRRASSVSIDMYCLIRIDTPSGVARPLAVVEEEIVHFGGTGDSITPHRDQLAVIPRAKALFLLRGPGLYKVQYR